MDVKDFTRIVNNFYTSKGIDADTGRIQTDLDLYNYIIPFSAKELPKYKVAFVFICLNPLYWEFAPRMVEGAKQLFLPGHNTDYFFWTDIPNDAWKINQALLDGFRGPLAAKGINMIDGPTFDRINAITQDLIALRQREDVNIIPTESVPWPFPTLLRYNLFLQQEEKLKEYDYIYYCDVDMQFVNIVGDEVLSDLTAALHPMYALDKRFWPPYEPNENSASYIKRPGKVIMEEGNKRFMPMYYAGGFQGGRSSKFIEAMKECRKIIESDTAKNYVPIWNDESAWNKYLSENEPDVVLSPSYIYPDSLINEYYIPLWGRNYLPKLMTLTKWFSTSKEGGQHLQETLSKPLPR